MRWPVGIRPLSKPDFVTGQCAAPELSHMQLLKENKIKTKQLNQSERLHQAVTNI